MGQSSVIVGSADLTSQGCHGRTLNATDLSVHLLGIPFSTCLGIPGQRWWSVAMNLAFQVLLGVQTTCGEKGKKGAKERSLQVAEWPVILQG